MMVFSWENVCIEDNNNVGLQMHMLLYLYQYLYPNDADNASKNIGFAILSKFQRCATHTRTHLFHKILFSTLIPSKHTHITSELDLTAEYWTK